MNTGVKFEKGWAKACMQIINFGSKSSGSVSGERSVACFSVWDIYIKPRQQ